MTHWIISWVTSTPGGSKMEVLAKKWHQKDATSLVGKLGKTSQWPQVLQLVQLAREPDDIFLSAAISACGRAQRWTAALSVFDFAPCESGKAYDAAISVCERCGQWQHALHLFEQMSSNSIQKGLVTFTTAIKACKEWSGALKYLKQLGEAFLQPDVLLYTALLNKVASHGRWQMAVATLDDMARNLVRADSFVYGVMMKSCEPGQWALALHFLQKSPSDVLTFNAGLNVCAKAGQWEICLKAFESLVRKDVVSYSICISSCEKASQWQPAVELLKDMLRAKVEPGEVSFNAAISACKNHPEMALHLFEDMEVLQVRRSVVTFNAALSACDKGLWQEAIFLMHKLQGQGGDIEPITLSGILTACESAWQVSLHVLASYMASGKVPHGLHAGSVVKAMASVHRASALALLQDLRKLWEDADGTRRDTSKSEAPDFKTWHEFLPSTSPSSADFDTIYREGQFMAVMKPAGISTEQMLQTVANQLSSCVFSISRLDLPTSGVLPLVLGRESSVAARWFLAQFAGTLVRKEYLCLCSGQVEPPSGRIDLPLLIEATSSSTSRAVVADVSSGAAMASTDYELLARLQSGNQVMSLVKACPRTGRLHQIRAHLAALGFPIIGDPIYGSAAGCKRLFLHCRSLKLLGFQGPMEVTAELPGDLKEVLRSLEVIQGEIPDMESEILGETAGQSVADEDQQALEALVQCQERHFPQIFAELDRGSKESHWAWYIFPTTLPGKSDPYSTYIKEETALELCTGPTAEDWRRVLEKLCDLLEARNVRPPDSHVLPPEDHGRVRYFVQFWKDYAKSPVWLLEVCERLERLQF